MEIKRELSATLTASYYVRMNLAQLLGVKRRTLDYRINSLVQTGQLERLKPGFYLNKRLFLSSQSKDELLEYVGSVLKYPSYVSLEYALAKYGVIPESVFAVTYCTTKKTAKYRSNTAKYSYQNIKKTLFCGFEERRVDGLPYYFATRAKALFDFIYLTPLPTAQDMSQLLFASRLRWEAFSTNDFKEFSSYCQLSGSKKMLRVIATLKRKGII